MRFFWCNWKITECQAFIDSRLYASPIESFLQVAPKSVSKQDYRSLLQKKIIKRHCQINPFSISRKYYQMIRFYLLIPIVIGVFFILCLLLIGGRSILYKSTTRIIGESFLKKDDYYQLERLMIAISLVVNQGFFLYTKLVLDIRTWS